MLSRLKKSKFELVEDRIEDDVQPEKSHRPSFKCIPKRLNPAGNPLIDSSLHRSLVHSKAQYTPAMSVASPLRPFASRAFGPWTCSTCSRSLLRLPRAQNAAFIARRCLNTANETRQGAVPTMDQMHGKYKQKNRTVMYARRPIEQ